MLPIHTANYNTFLCTIKQGLFYALLAGLIKLSWVKDAGKFLIAVMPVMFIPAGVGLMSSWGVLKPMLVPVLVVTVVAIITVMAVTGQASQIIIRADKKRELRKAQRNEVNTNE